MEVFFIVIIVLNAEWYFIQLDWIITVYTSRER